jgi:hypothetical protein
MTIPSFSKFVANERQFYAYVIIIALIYIFVNYKSSQDKQIETYKQMLIKCDSEKVILNEKIQHILEKQQELINTKKTIDSL